MDVNDITYRINGAVFEVNRELGHGFLEKIYEHALLIELQEQGLKAESRVPLKVFYHARAEIKHMLLGLTEDGSFRPQGRPRSSAPVCG